MPTINNNLRNNGTHKLTESKIEYATIGGRPMRMKILNKCLTWDDGVSLIEHSYFNTTEEQKLVKFLKHYHDTYNQLPDKTEIEYEFKMHDELMHNLLNDVFDANSSEYTKDSIIKFAKHQALDNAIMEYARLKDAGKPTDNAALLLEQVETIGIDNQWLTLDHVLNYDYKKYNWILNGYFAESNLVCMYGESGIGKTWLLLIMLMHIATGRPFLGIPVQQSTVFLIDQENRLDRLMRRLLGVICQMHIEPESFNDKFKFISMPQPHMYANDLARMKQLAVDVNKTTGPKVIAFDNLGTISRANMSDDNMRDVMNGLLYLTEITGASVVFDHHKPKYENVIYGSQYIRASVDVALEIVPMSGKKYPGKDAPYGEHVMLITAGDNSSSNSGKKRDNDIQDLLVELIIDGLDTDRIPINPRIVRLDDVDLDTVKSIMKQKHAEKATITEEALKTLAELQHNHDIMALIAIKQGKLSRDDLIDGMIKIAGLKYGGRGKLRSIIKLATDRGILVKEGAYGFKFG